MTSPIRGAVQVRNRPDFERFSDVLSSAERAPVVVVTGPPHGSPPGTPPPFDVAKLETELEDAAHLYVLSADATFWLTDRLGKALSVHSGWARVYPSARDWRSNPDLAPRFRPAAREPERGRTVDRIVAAVLDASFRDGGAPAATAVAAAGDAATAKVLGILSATQALVMTDERTQAVMRTHRLAAGLPAGRVVQPGQRFRGRLTPVGLMDEFSPDAVVVDQLVRARQFVGDGVVTVARVSAVGPDGVRVQLHPDVVVSIPAERGQDPMSLAGVGDVVTIEVVRVEHELMATFSEEEPGPAMSVLPDGPPWLEAEPLPPLPSTTAPAAAQAPAGSPDSPGSTSEAPGVAAGGAERRADDTAALEEEIERLEAGLLEAEETIRWLQRRLRTSGSTSFAVVFRDPARQFRHELDQTYLYAVDEADRARYPWPERYHLADGFLDSVDQLVAPGGISRRKVIEVCAEVLCGRARDSAARAVKAWAARGQPLIRDRDRARAMRVRLQTGTHGARRLRYWVLANGEIELDQVSVHDDDIDT